MSRNIGAEVSDELHERLRTAVEESGVYKSQSEFMRHAIDEKLRNEGY